MANQFLEKIDGIYETIESFLNGYCCSTKLQNIFSNFLISFIYGNIINNFFINLTQENIKEYSLPKGKIGKIKEKFSDICNEAKNATSISNIYENITEKTYENFKENIKENLKEFYLIIEHIEKEIDYNKIKLVIKEYTKKIKTTGIKSDDDFYLFVVTSVIELHIEKHHQLPKNISKINNVVKDITTNSITSTADSIVKTLDKNLSRMIKDENRLKRSFETELFSLWEKPINFLEGLINISLESVEQHYTTLTENIDEIGQYKLEALTKLHIRAINVSKEILLLCKSGYPDGAIARWRSLYELSITMVFLAENEDWVAEQYLDHIYVSDYKEATAYKNCYRKLGYTAIGKKTYSIIKKNHEMVNKKYGQGYSKDYGWIPKSILKDRNFYALEKFVKFEKYRTIYKTASRMIHSNPNSFSSLATVHYEQDIMLLGPSLLGLSEPIENCTISILYISLAILNLSPDFNSILNIKIISTWVSKTRDSVYDTLEQIEEKGLTNHDT